VKRCIKCEVELSGRELEVGKQKCTICLVKAYKFVLAKMHREIEALEAQLKKGGD
jgi:hypothetical protein